MFLKNWIVIVCLAAVGVFLTWYWLSLPPKGVTPQGGTDDIVTAVAAIAGAVTTLGGAVFGVLGKLNDYKLAKLAIEEKRMALDEKKKSSAET